jgi:hypothetical protein
MGMQDNKWWKIQQRLFAFRQRLWLESREAHPRYQLWYD